MATPRGPARPAPSRRSPGVLSAREGLAEAAPAASAALQPPSRSCRGLPQSGALAGGLERTWQPTSTGLAAAVPDRSGCGRTAKYRARLTSVLPWGTFLRLEARPSSGDPASLGLARRPARSGVGGPPGDLRAAQDTSVFPLPPSPEGTSARRKAPFLELGGGHSPQAEAAPKLPGFSSGGCG